MAGHSSTTRFPGVSSTVACRVGCVPAPLSKPRRCASHRTALGRQDASAGGVEDREQRRPGAFACTGEPGGRAVTARLLALGPDRAFGAYAHAGGGDSFTALGRALWIIQSRCEGESVLETGLRTGGEKQFVPSVAPSRSGFHPRVVMTLRSYSGKVTEEQGNDRRRKRQS